MSFLSQGSQARYRLLIPKFSRLPYHRLSHWARALSENTRFGVLKFIPRTFLTQKWITAHSSGTVLKIRQDPWMHIYYKVIVMCDFSPIHNIILHVPGMAQIQYYFSSRNRGWTPSFLSSSCRFTVVRNEVLDKSEFRSKNLNQVLADL